MTSSTFGRHAVLLHHQLLDQGLALHDMRSAVSLEDRLGSDLATEETGRESHQEPEFTWLERSHPFSLPVAASATPTPIRYFLDGTQRTLPAYHQSAIPIMASVTASAILERRSPTDLGVVPGMLHLNRSWLVPLEADIPEISTFITSVREDGVGIVDPLEHYDAAGYQARLRDFGGMEQAALASSRRLRRQGEELLLRRWAGNPLDDASWIVVDGALREPAPRTIGLVKSFNRQYLSGNEADALFRLPASHRSPAFLVDDRRHGGSYIVWYLRFWDAAGLDPRYSLVRIEIADSDANRRLIDPLSGWILAERRPRATADSRWPTLLYPIHFLEKILKSYLSREIREWPGIRGTA